MSVLTQPQASSHEIHELLGRMVTAWNGGDAAAFAEQFTADAEFISWRGNRDTGRTAIEATHRTLFDGPLKGATMGKGAGLAVDIKLLTPDVALVIVDGAQVDNSPTALVVTLTAVREHGHWRFASFQNTMKTAPTDGRGGTRR